jgi:calcineurin-like phosphoesterase family protein
MSKTWVTADWHLGEDRFKIMARPFQTAEEMVTTLVANHNKLVAPEDKVYMLGDVCYQKKPEFLEHVARFNGQKILIRGNHDRVFSDADLAKYFCEIIPEGEGLEVNFGINYKCYLTHYPSCGRKDYFNLVGHIHSAWKYQLNMLNVGVDAHHFYPINDGDISFGFEAVSKFYDRDVWIAYDPCNADYVGVRGQQTSYFSKS